VSDYRDCPTWMLHQIVRNCIRNIRAGHPSAMDREYWKHVIVEVNSELRKIYLEI
jgi:hypothetical protein